MKQYSFCLFTTAVFANRIIFKNSKKTLPPPPLESVDLYYEIGWRIKFIALIAAFLSHLIYLLFTIFLTSYEKPITVKVWIKTNSGCPIVNDYSIRIFFQDVNKGMIHFRVSVLHVQMDAIYSGKKVAKKSSASLLVRKKEKKRHYIIQAAS
jgi:hypothetical protein